MHIDYAFYLVWGGFRAKAEHPLQSSKNEKMKNQLCTKMWISGALWS